MIATKKTTKKKPIAKKPAVAKKKPVAKKTSVTKKKTAVKKKPAKKFIRKEVLLCSVVHNLLVNAKDRDQGRPNVFLLGEDEDHIVRKVIKLDATSGGCNEMPTLDRESLYKAYIVMNKKKLVPSGIARVRPRFINNAKWHTDAGRAVYRNIGYMLSIDDENIHAQIYNRNKETSRGHMKHLTVGVTDK